MGLLETILCWLPPTLGMIFGHYVAYPYLLGLGMEDLTAYFIATVPIVVLMLIASLVAYQVEGRPWTWAAFSQRFRLGRMGRHEWLWSVLGLLVLLIVAQGLNMGLLALYEALHFTPPSFTFQAFNPLLMLTLLFFNIVGEEFWWRGYMLPRQEAHFGRTAFLVNGVMWAFFHLFKWWAVPAMLLLCLIIPYTSQRLKHNGPAIFLHFMQNGLGVVLGIILTLLK